MTVLAIRITGDPVLHAPAGEITRINDTIRELAADMIETMTAAPGVGLAAPQVGVPLRLFVYDWTDADGERHEGVAINPTLLVSPLELREADEEDEQEGCLSVPGERFPLVRADHALLRARDLDGQPYEREAHGWLARIFQHEFDHLNGLLYVDRLDHANQKLARRAIKKNSWGSPGQSWLPGVDHLDD